jgi:hypothetical protein
MSGTFRQNGYKNLDVKHDLVLKQRLQIQKENPAGIVMILFQQAVSNKISRLLAKCNINTFHTLRKKNICMFRFIKEK